MDVNEWEVRNCWDADFAHGDPGFLSQSAIAFCRQHLGARHKWEPERPFFFWSTEPCVYDTLG